MLILFCKFIKFVVEKEFLSFFYIGNNVKKLLQLFWMKIINWGSLNQIWVASFKFEYFRICLLFVRLIVGQHWFYLIGKFFGLDGHASIGWAILVCGALSPFEVNFKICYRFLFYNTIIVTQPRVFVVGDDLCSLDWLVTDLVWRNL